jgi:hypothetical protein
VIENKQIMAKITKNPHLKNKLKAKKPQGRGYVHWDETIYQRLVASPPEPLEPRFEVNHGMIVTALQSDAGSKRGGYGRLVQILRNSHISDGQKRYQLCRLAALFRSLRKAGIVEILPRPQGHGSYARVKSGLQPDFSLHQTLSLYLVEALNLVDPYAEHYALDMLSLVEAILEDPTVILFRQIDRIKDELIAEWKAAGVPYEERMERLEKVEHPKPLAELIYSSFNTFAEYHPWVGGENIRPKSVARDMFEKCFGFNDYIQELGAARSEGILLRYLSQVYKTAYQNIPQFYWNEQYEDILSFLHTMIRRVDASLLDEWERMVHGEPLGSPRAQAPEAPAMPPRPRDPSLEPKAFAARIRSELFLLLKTLADKDYEQSCLMIRQSEEHLWDAERFAQALAPYWADYDRIDLTPAARQPSHTFLRPLGRKKWQVQHKIIDPKADGDWGILGQIDLTELPEDDSLPLVELITIGI